MVDVSQDVLDKAKKKLAKLSDGWTAGVCLGETIYLDGEVFGAAHTACHSWLTAAYHTATGSGSYSGWNKAYTKNSKNFLTLNCHSRERSRLVCSAAACDFLVLWMAKESPFSQFILNRDDEKSLTESGVIILCGPDGATVAEAMWICKVLRFCTEGAKAAETFMTLVKGGVDPLLAVLVSSHIRTVKGATFGYTGLEGHSTVFGYPGKADVVGLLSHSVNRAAASTSDVFAAPKDLKMAGFGKKAVIEDPAKKIQGFCKPYKKDDGWGGSVSGTGATGEELVACVLEWQQEIGGRLQPEAIKPPQMPTENTVYLDLDL